MGECWHCRRRAPKAARSSRTRYSHRSPPQGRRRFHHLAGARKIPSPAPELESSRVMNPTALAAGSARSHRRVPPPSSKQPPGIPSPGSTKPASSPRSGAGLLPAERQGCLTPHFTARRCGAAEGSSRHRPAEKAPRGDSERAPGAGEPGGPSPAPRCRGDAAPPCLPPASRHVGCAAGGLEGLPQSWGTKGHQGAPRDTEGQPGARRDSEGQRGAACPRPLAGGGERARAAADLPLHPFPITS